MKPEIRTLLRKEYSVKLSNIQPGEIRLVLIGKDPTGKLPYTYYFYLLDMKSGTKTQIIGGNFNLKPQPYS